MNYMDAYTPYTLFFAVLITTCMIASALFNAYIMIKVRKTMLYWAFVLVQLLLLIWLSGKLMALVSPTLEIRDFYLSLQQVGSLLLVPALLLFLYSLWKYGIDRTMIFSFCLFSLTVFVCIAGAFFISSGLIRDLLPLCTFLAVNIHAVYFRRSLFAELSELSMDTFMEGLEDAVIIFDSCGNLLDFNKNSKTIMQNIHELETLNNFVQRINEKIVSGKKLPTSADVRQEPAEVDIMGPSGIKCYICNRTISRNKKNLLVATTFTFHDVTEKTMLLHELEGKKDELDRLNAQLKNHIAVANRLEEEKEKNRAIMEIHETIGHSITELLFALQVFKMAGSEHETTVKEKLSEIIYKCREIMLEIRILVEKLIPGKNERK